MYSVLLPIINNAMKVKLQIRNNRIFDENEFQI